MLVDLDKKYKIDKENLYQKVKILLFNGNEILWKSSNDHKRRKNCL